MKRNAAIAPFSPASCRAALATARAVAKRNGLSLILRREEGRHVLEFADFEDPDCLGLEWAFRGTADDEAEGVPGNPQVAAPAVIPVATHDKDQALDQCIGREISALVAADPDIERWDQVADRVKANLVGSIRPIDVPVKTGEIEDDDGNKVPTYKFEPLLDNEGRPVVREITAEDIDRLGEAVVSTILNG